MQTFERLIHKFSSLVKLQQFYHYQFLFLISASLYHSLDYFQSFTITQPKYKFFIFYILDYINFNIALTLLTIISLGFSLIIVFQLILSKRFNFLIQILQKILFPIQIYLIIKKCTHTYQNSTQEQKLINLSIFTIFCLSAIFTLFLIITLNIKLNIRYGKNKQVGYYRLFKCSFLLQIFKLLFHLIASLLIPNLSIQYLLVICCINLSSNLLFFFKIFYENPTYQYLQTLTQIYLWIPVGIKFMVLNNFNDTISQILSSLCFIVYLGIGLSKPSIIMNLLQMKYTVTINEYNQSQIEGRKKSNGIFNNIGELTLSYFSITLPIFLNVKDELKWSQGFKAQVFKSLTTNIKKKLVCKLQKKNVIIRNSQNKQISQNTLKQNTLKQATLKQSTIKQTTINKTIQGQIPSSIYQQFYQKFTLSGQYQSSLYQYSELWLYIEHVTYDLCKYSKLMLFLCYNLLGITNIMKQQLFYLHFLNESIIKDNFEQIDCEVCFNWLIEKIGKQLQHNKYKKQNVQMFDIQKQHNNKTNHSFIQNQINLQVFPSIYNKNNIQKTIQSIYTIRNKQYCIFQQQLYFNSQFNDYINQHQLFQLILKHLQQFTINQELYLKINTQPNINKKYIILYLKKRNSLRHQIQQEIQSYNSINYKTSKTTIKLYGSSLLNYIQDYWLNHNSLKAVQKFQKALQQYFMFKKSSQISIYNHQNQSQQNQSNKKIICFISAVLKPDNLMICCSQFKKSLEVTYQPSFLHKSQQISQTEDESSHQTNFHSLMLPVFRQKHQKYIYSFHQGPINHQQKGGYYLISKKRTNVFEIKFKMYFHMMYQKDLLIVLDIKSQKIKNLIITDKERKKIFFHHIQKDLLNDNKIQKLQKISKKLRQKTLRKATKQKQKILQVNLQDISLCQQMQTQYIKVFKNQYKVSITRQQNSYVSDIYEFLQKKETNQKTIIRIGNQISENQLNIYKRQKQLQEDKFSRYKQDFDEGKKDFIVIVGYQIFFLIIAILGLIMLIIQQRNSIKQMIYIIRDKMQLQQSYAKDMFNKAVDIGMLNGIYTNQINFHQITTQDQILLYNHIITSMKNSINTMKDRHLINPFLITQTFKSDHYWSPYWINTQNISFQMMTYKSEMLFLQCSRSYFKIIQPVFPHNNSLNVLTNHQIILKQSQQTNVSKSLQNIWAYQYFLRLTADQQYYLKPKNGIFAEFSLEQAQIFTNSQYKQNIIMQAIFVTFFIIVFIKIGFVVKLIKGLTRKYRISLQTSDKFIKQFNKQNELLKKCIHQMKNFNKQWMFNMIKPKQLNYKQLKQKNRYIVSNQKDNTNKNKLSLDEISSNKKNLVQNNHKCQNRYNDNKQNENKISFTSFQFAFLKYGILVSIIVFCIFQFSTNSYSKKVQNLKTFSTGLKQLTQVNLLLLNLMSSNLFVTTKQSHQTSKVQQQKFRNQLISQFTTNITYISLVNKIQLVTNLFLNQRQNDYMAAQILYSTNLCLQFQNQMQCPQYMINKITGLAQKYGQTIKSINVLFHKLINSPKTINGTVDTQSYQMRYIESYQNMNELLYLCIKIRQMAFHEMEKFINFQISTSVNDSNQPNNSYSTQIGIILSLAICLVVEGVIFLMNLGYQYKVIREQFLRIGDYRMFENEKNNFEGYGRYINESKKKEWLQKD